MAQTVLTACKFWLGKYDLAGYTNAFAYDAGRELLINTAFGDTGKRRKAGLHRIDAQLEGFMNDTEILVAPLDAPFSKIFPMRAAIYDDGGAFTDQTTDANDAGANDMTLLPVAPLADDAYYFGGFCKFDKLTLKIGTAGDGVWTIVWEYWDGAAWSPLTNVQDNTLAFEAAAGDHDVTFTIPSDWTGVLVDALTAYFIRARVSAFTSIVTRPLGTQAWYSVPSIPITFSPEGTVDGPAYSFDCQGAEYSIGGVVGEMLKYTVKVEGNGVPLHRGTLMLTGTKTVTGASSILDLGTVEDATKTLHAYLHVTDSGAAGDTLDVIVESDTLVGFGTPTTQITFNQVTGGEEVFEHLTKVGPLVDVADTFWRVSYTIGGAPATFTFSIALAIVSNTL